MKLLIFPSCKDNIKIPATLFGGVDETVVISTPDESNLHSSKWDAVVQYYSDLLPKMRSNLRQYAPHTSDAYSIIERDIGSLYATYYALIENVPIKPIFMSTEIGGMTKFAVQKRDLIDHIFAMIFNNAQIDHPLQNVVVLNALRMQYQCNAPLWNGRVFSITETT